MEQAGLRNFRENRFAQHPASQRNGGLRKGHKINRKTITPQKPLTFLNTDYPTNEEGGTFAQATLVWHVVAIFEKSENSRKSLTNSDISNASLFPKYLLEETTFAQKTLA